MIINDYKIQLNPKELGLGQVPVSVNVDQAEQLLTVRCCLRIIILIIIINCDITNIINDVFVQNKNVPIQSNRSSV